MSVYEPSSPDVNKWRSDAELIPHDDAFHSDEQDNDVFIEMVVQIVWVCKFMVFAGIGIAFGFAVWWFAKALGYF